MQEVKAILFDFGGVVLNIDFERSYRAFMQLGGSSFNDLYSLHHQDDLFDRYERGLITTKTFLSGLKHWIPDASLLQLEKAWNAMLLDFPDNRFHLLQALKKRYEIYLLSNSCEVHYQLYTSRLHEKYGLKDWNELFHRAYFSHQIHLRKPDSDVYHHVLEQIGFDAAEVLFIDDSPVNIKAARNVGLQTYHLKKGEDILQLFDQNYKLIV